MSNTKWKLDLAHSELSFKIKHLMITNVSGTFKNFNVDVETDGVDFTSAVVKAVVDVPSITTNNDQRDQHLRNSDFFEADQHPQIVFQSTSVDKEDDTTFAIAGDLTMKGVTRPVVLAVELGGVTKDPWGNEKAGFTISGKLNRNDWGINFNSALETGGVMLGEEVKIHGEIQLVKQAAAVAA
ncbi:MAG TPA: YceI family protein [Chryseosolibacter sp.]|nr:YceI family protein [Chryseosolibacter sp.]